MPSIYAKEDLDSYNYREDDKGNKSLTRQWFVRCTDDGQEAIMAPGIPTCGSTFREDLFVREISAKVLNSLSPGHPDNCCKVTVEYSNEVEQVGDEIISFDTSAQTVHVEKCISQTTWDAKGNVVAESLALGHPCLVGVQNDGVKGVDIYVPGFSWNVKAKFNPEDVTNPYIGSLVAMTATVNNDAWRGFARGGTIFLGATCYDIDKTPLVEIFFRFEAKSSKIIKDPGGTERVALGWEYPWYKFLPRKTPTIGNKGWTTETASISKVYEETDFTELGLGA